MQSVEAAPACGWTPASKKIVADDSMENKEWEGYLETHDIIQATRVSNVRVSPSVPWRSQTSMPAARLIRPHPNYYCRPAYP